MGLERGPGQLVSTVLQTATPLVTSARARFIVRLLRPRPLPPEEPSSGLLGRTQRRNRARRLGRPSAVRHDFSGDNPTSTGEAIPASGGTPDVVDADEVTETVATRPLTEVGRLNEIARRSVPSEEGSEDRFVARHERQRTAGQTAMPEPAGPSRNAPIVDHLPAVNPAPATASVDGPHRPVPERAGTCAKTARMP
jgi:hypothetical protein